jgi:alpha-L-fucosidase
MKKCIALVIGVCFALSSFAQALSKDTRMQWWRDARFGMFIHWGIYAVPAGEYKGDKNNAEWIMNKAKIPIQEY